MATLRWPQLNLVEGGNATKFWASQPRPRRGLVPSEQQRGRFWWEAPAVFEALVLVALVVVLVVVSPCYTTCPLTSYHCLPPALFFLAQGEALRQILVNRYYGNFHRSGGRRESLTSFGSSPLSPVGPGKNQSGGKKLLLLLLMFSSCLSVSEILALFLFVLLVGGR